MEFKSIASGYCFLEAPRVVGDVLWFSDLLLGGLYRLSPGGQVDTFLPEVKHIGGVVSNDDGAIICGGTQGLLWFDPATGRSAVLLDRIDGAAIPGVNDMYPDGKGGLYFGTLAVAGPDGPSPTGLYHIDATGHVRLLRDKLHPSNGIGISPDGRRLYHNESLLGTFAYDILPDGTLANRTPFADQQDCDGLAVDSEGGVWSAYFDSGEAIRFAPDGRIERREPLPHKVVSSLCFGGPDQCDLYVVTAGDEGIAGLISGQLPPRIASVFHARSAIAGVAVPRTAFRPAEA